MFKTPPIVPEADRLPADRWQPLRAALREAGFTLHEQAATDEKLAELRGMYEPFVSALAKRFLFSLPEIAPRDSSADNWQRSAWMKRAPKLGDLPIVTTGEGHFE